MVEIRDNSLSKAQLREFIYRLAGEEGCQFSGGQWRCGGKEFVYARKILDKMNIPKFYRKWLTNKVRELVSFLKP